MSYKFDSLMIILNKLDSNEKVTVSSLSEELEVSERTILRYMNTLLVAGFPVSFDRNKNSYVFDEGYALKKPDLSLEETLAFALARKVMFNFGPGMEKSLCDIESKLSKHKPDDLKHIILSAETMPASSEKYLGIIHRAIMNYQRIKLVYKSLYAEKPTESKIDPYYLFFREGIWYLRGYYHIEKAVRTFALDRIISLDLLIEHYIPKKISPEEELSGAFGAFVDGEPVEVVLKFDINCKPLVLRKKWHKSQQTRELEDGQIELKFKVNGLIGIKNWVCHWIPHVEVIAPQKLRDAFKADLIEALKKHNK